MQLKELYRLLNKQNCVCSNIIVIISVLYMHYEVSKDDFTLRSLLNHQTSEVFQGLYSSTFLTSYVFDFWLAEKYFKTSWKVVQPKPDQLDWFRHFWFNTVSLHYKELYIWYNICSTWFLDIIRRLVPNSKDWHEKMATNFHTSQHTLKSFTW